MRYLAAVLGLFLGIVAGVALLAWNPLMWPGVLTGDTAARRTYGGESFRGMDGSVADLLGLAPEAGTAEPRAGGPLPGATLSGVRIGMVRLPSGAGSPAALAVKVSVIDGSNALWRARLGTDDYWNIFWPGEGSVFAAGYSNAWPLVRDRLALLVGVAQGADDGSPLRLLSAPPPAGVWTGVIGASGRYAGYVGGIREWRGVSSDQVAGQVAEQAIEIKVVPPPVVTR